MNIDKVINAYLPNQELNSYKAFGSGHINSTYKVIMGDGEELLLQKINHQIFNNVTGLMSNIASVTKHINDKKKGFTLELIPTATDQDYYKDMDGNFWRLFVFRSDLHSVDVAETEAQIYQGGKAFGQFLRLLDDFDAQSLHVTIPDFHNVLSRVVNLKKAIDNDSKDRVQACEQEIKFAMSVVHQLSQIEQAGKAGNIPLRVTHNDTKFNNVLLDKNGHGGCVIDLETVMPGYIHYDLGDGIRTSISTAAEDEQDLNAITLDMGRFSAFANGFLTETKEILSSEEIELLPLSGPLLSYLMGIRFLTDHIEGDVYYKIHHAGHNLERAKAQLHLTALMLEEQEKMTNIIHQHLGL